MSFLRDTYYSEQIFIEYPKKFFLTMLSYWIQQWILWRWIHYLCILLLQLHEWLRILFKIYKSIPNKYHGCIKRQGADLVTYLVVEDFQEWSFGGRVYIAAATDRSSAWKPSTLCVAVASIVLASKLHSIGTYIVVYYVQASIYPPLFCFAS